MKRKRKKSINDLMDTLLTIDIFISLVIYIKTKNFKQAGIFFFLFVIVIAIVAFLYKSATRKEYLNSGIEVVDKMSGEEFEEFLSVHFQKLGYKVDPTPTTNDYGADLILKKDNVKLVIQAKRWKTKVGIGAIQEIVAAIKYYNADKGVVISNNFFTKNAYELASRNNIELWNRNKLIEIMSKHNGKSIANNEIYESIIVQDKEDICPKCGYKLIIRTGKRGKFWGCSNFPNCKFTKNINL